METHIELLKSFLPELLINHFNVIRYHTEDDALHIHFEEKSERPPEFTSDSIIAHGFHKEITIQDFPIRGKSVFLHIKRRRWLNKQNRTVVQRDWNLVSRGTRMTTEFADFLKEISQY